MQSIDEFNDNLGTAILLTGAAGAGKTSLALRLFPKTYVFVADLNFKSGVDYLRKLGPNAIKNVVGFDTATPDEKGVKVPPNLRYDRMFKCLSEATKNPEVDVIVLDSVTFIEDILKAKIANATIDSAIKLSGYDQWGTLVITWKSLIMQLRQSGKKLIMTAHETKEKDESDMIFKYQIAVDGSIRDKFPALFSDVWRCEITEVGGKHQWMLRTLSNVRHEYLKNTQGFDAHIKQDDAVRLIHEKYNNKIAP